MSKIRAFPWRKFVRSTIRKALANSPKSLRHSIYRFMADCDPAPDPRLQLKIADTQEELAACFALLHDAYVNEGYMVLDPSGMRVTMYHALPTTTTLCAKYDGEVVGTISLIREGVFGFPLQAVFDLAPVRAKAGQIAEVSALAVHPKYRKTGGAILFPLMKFMYEYCTAFFDTRHLVIAVHPTRIDLYESLLFFKHLAENRVDGYDFANGAPAIGATLDLQTAPETLKRAYGHKSPRRNLHNYFVNIKLPNIRMPSRRYYTTNDPVMTPALLDHFFNKATNGFAQLDDRKRLLLQTIYDLGTYAHVLPKPSDAAGAAKTLRQHSRYSIKCPAEFVDTEPGAPPAAPLPAEARQVGQVIELSKFGFQAHSQQPLPMNRWIEARVQLGDKEVSTVRAMAVRDHTNGYMGFYGFRIAEPDLPWLKCVAALESGSTHGDLESATMYLQ